MRSSWVIRMVPESNGKDWERGGEALWRWRWRLELCSHKPRTAWRDKEGFSPRPWKGTCLP